MRKAEVTAIYNKLEPEAKSRDEALIREARTLTKLQARRRVLSRDLREVARQIKVTKKNLRSLMATDHAPRAWNESAPPLKVFGES